MTDPNKPDDQTPSDDQNSADDASAQDPQNVSDDDWAAAMSEQDVNEDTGAAEEDDPWAAAMAEQEAADEPSASDDAPEATTEAPQAREASSDVFPPLNAEHASGVSRDLEMIMDIPVKLTVELGRTRLTIKQLLELAQGSVIELDGLAGEPMDILINGYLIAQGEVVVIEDKYGIRITEIITPSERIHKLNR
ncbi:flagellar motor switch protein FliN [Vreelandella subglaciescola]|jgi:flagellar motor switch protein FliN/FliY|uniref:Flagellar motor switch protein FliN n=1 Tax=Vreelandella subglaciescola TaxID=29571 RepID=A0A1M7HFI4_9GAMM|nr:flagellar motor switch protein FliN [Halomonas subglaciescola]SHM27204.1 flagellar motor switch protein FliN/FliY [Halomonas subglaciescola]